MTVLFAQPQTTAAASKAGAVAYAPNTHQGTAAGVGLKS
jgi:hypothetical protein